MRENLQKIKILLLLLAITILSIFNLSCSEKKNEDGSKITIKFWHSFVSSSVPALNDLINRFEKEHPNIIIDAQYIPTGDALIQKLVTSIQSKTAPDISWLHSDYMEDLVNADAIYKMEHFIKGKNGISEKDINDIYPALLKYASWRGTLYSMPMEATNLALLYNKEMFRQAGLDPNKPPQTWEELHDFASRLTIDKNHDGVNDQTGLFLPVFPAAGPYGGWMVWQWLPYLWQAGGYVISEDQSHITYNSEAGVKALMLWRDIYDELKLNTFTTDFDVAFASGRLAMTMDGPWDLPRFKDLLKNLDWAFAPLPAGPAKKATIVGGEYLAVFKQSQHPDEAWEFIKWIISPEIQAYWAMKSGYLPVRHSSNDVPEFKKYLTEHPNYKVFVDQMEVAQAQRMIDYGGLMVTRNIGEAIEQAIAGHIDPAQALNISAEKSNRAINSRKPASK